MSTQDNGGPAFPGTKPVYRMGYLTDETVPVNGMTLRDYFAAKVLLSLVVDGAALEACKQAAKRAGEEGMFTTARVAYAYADAMLKARQS